MHVLAAAGGSANGPGVWAYLAILAATAAGYMGVPFIGTAAIGAAAVFASQGKLNIAAVLIVAVIAKGETIYQRWGRLAVFLSVGPAAYGAGRVASGHHDLVSVSMLVGGVAVGTLCVVLGVRHHRRRRPRPGTILDPERLARTRLRKGAEEMAVLLAFLAACSLALGNVLQQKGDVETSAGTHGARFLVRIPSHPVWLVGLAMQVLLPCRSSSAPSP